MRIIAYYLPQYHEIPENNAWWDKGFTEWYNVKNAGSLYKGHDQPKIPGELGYYDLNDPNIRERQAQLAKDAGIEAFCYWHYWFGNGKQLLEMPFNEVLSTKKPNFSFCLGWANESWKAKVWSNPSGNDDKILIEQLYPGDDDIRNHFISLLTAFRDERYVKVDGKPLFVIYKPFQIPDIKRFIGLWNQLAQENGLKGIFFVAHTLYSTEINALLKLGYDAVNVVRLGDIRRSGKLILLHLFNLLQYSLNKKPLRYHYRNALSELTGRENMREEVFPTILPNWDNTPRSGVHGFVLHNSSPGYFLRHIRQVIRSVTHKPAERQIVFLKSWNEWGEGNYIEPDKKFGNGYLEVLKSQVFPTSK